MKIRDLHPRRPVEIGEGGSLRDAAKHLAEDDIGALLVFGSTAPSGILSERDLARAVADTVDLDATPVEEYMTRSPVCVETNAPLGQAIAEMNEFGVRHLMVTEGEHVVGMISMRDVFRLLGTSWPEL